MSLADGRTHVFIVRIWQEKREIEGAQPLWRGVVEHVSSGDRCYTEDLDDVSQFILRYLTTGDHPHSTVL